jgi:adenylyltransferase/sulfurtransferase
MTKAPPTAPHPALTADALAAIYAHARRDYPNECCGVVFGPKEVRTADRATACANIQDRLHAEDPMRNPRSARTAYALDVPDLLKLSKSLRGPEPAKIIYHSHVDIPVGTYFSDTDQSVAQFDGEPTFEGIEYIVVDVKADGTHGAAQFAWDAEQKRYVEVGRYE